MSEEKMEKLRELAKDILSKAKAKGAENAQVTLTQLRSIGTRYGESHITQNTDIKKLLFRLELQVGDKFSVFNGPNPGNSNLDNQIEKAVSTTKSGMKDPNHPGFLTEKQHYPNFSVNSNKISVQEVADSIKQVIDVATTVNPRISAVAGNVEHNQTIHCALNTFGISASDFGSNITAVINVAATESENESRSTIKVAGRNITSLNLEEQAQTVATRAYHGLNQKEKEVGKFEVILSPMAISELVFFLVFALSSEALIQQASFLKDKIGEQVFDSRLTLDDDINNPDHYSSRKFDSDLVPSLPLTPIKAGVIHEFAYNRKNAKILGAESNGRNFSIYDSVIPFFSAPSLKPGNKSEDELIQSVDNGLYISNLFYNNFVNPPEGTCTGLTRDGLFEIKNGMIAGSVKNFRWTDSLTSIFKDAEPGSNTTQIGSFFEGGIISPSFKVGAFNFSSKGKH